MNNKYLLVVERSESQLTIAKTDEKYVLEGVFTEIGVKNNNQRIYDEKEVIPHVNELKKLCVGNKLLGELDHPKSFDISLKNASHVIEDLSYDKDKKQVIGRIRLLNTEAGKNAMALVDAGIPLHISSRAAGVVENNGHVKIKKMFTYDLVATPGFSNAELKRVNESFGLSEDDNLQLFEVPWTIEDKETNNTTEIKENTGMDNSKYISIDDFNQYTKLIKNEFEALKSKLQESTKSEGNEKSVKEGLIKYTESIAKQVNSLQESVEGLISHNDYIVENLEKVKDYAELIGEKSNLGINYSEKLAESVDHLIQYTKMVAEKTDQSIEYAKMVAEKTDQSIEYAKMVAEKTDQSIEYSKYVANESSNRWAYQQHINENLDKVISHNDYIVEGVDALTKYTEYGIKETERLQSFVDFTIKRINEGLQSEEPTKNEIIKEVKTPGSITESLKIDTDDDFKKTITTQLNAILESAKEEKESTVIKTHHFLNFLSENRRNQFEALTPEMKQTVVDKFASTSYFGSADAERIFESVFVQPVAKLNWLNNMPSKYVSSWNSLNESQKTAIKAQASIRLLETQYQIDDFWATRDLRAVKPETANLERPINESSTYETKGEYMDAVVEGLRKRFKR
jgi:hypothetical protein